MSDTPIDKLKDFIDNELDSLFDDWFKILEKGPIDDVDPELPSVEVKYKFCDEEFHIMFLVLDEAIQIEFCEDTYEYAEREYVWAYTMFGLEQRLRELKERG